MIETLTGDENGLLKLVREKTYFRFGDDQSRDNSIIGLQAFNVDKSTGNYISNSIISVLRRNKSIELWKDQGFGNLVKFDEWSVSISEPVGLIQGDVIENMINLVVYGRHGEISIISASVDGFNRNKGDEHATSSSSSYSNSFRIQGPLSAGASCPNGFAFGGNENDLKLYDQTTHQCVWQAKNVPHDKLRLRVPIWITSISFVQPQSCSISSGASIVTGTGYKHVRLYDTRVPTRQPTISINASEDYRVTVVKPTLDGSEVFVGDTSGGLHLWDLKVCRRKNTLKGCAGSIRDIQLSGDGHFVGAVGLDRFLRIYSVGTSKYSIESSVYLKNRLNCCLLFDVNGGKQRADDRSVGYAQDDDDVDVQLDTVKDYQDWSDEDFDDELVDEKDDEDISGNCDAADAYNDSEEEPPKNPCKAPTTGKSLLNGKKNKVTKPTSKRESNKRQKRK